jgi:signal peptidase II
MEIEDNNLKMEKDNSDNSIHLEIEEKPKFTLFDGISLFSVVGLIIGLDQWTKALIRESLSTGEFISPFPEIFSFIKFVNWYNRGAAFGFFQNSGLIFIILAFVVSVFIILYFPQVPREEWWLRLAMGMQMGGALGNAIDRLMRGYVTDFIAVGNFPVFNIADSAISVGAAIFIIGIWINEKKLKVDNQDVLADDNIKKVVLGEE